MSAPFDPMRASSESDAELRPRIPDSISIAVELWAVVVVGQVVALFAQTGTFVDLVRDQVRDNPPNGVSEDQLQFMTSSGFVIGILVAMSVFLTAITALVVWFTRKGYNWARIVLGAMGVYIVVNLVFSLFGDTDPAWAMVPLVISGVAALGATVLLMRADSEKYCRRMAEERKPRPVPPPAPPYPYGQNPYGQNPYGQYPYGQNPSQPGTQPGDTPYGDSSPEAAARGGSSEAGGAGTPDLRKPESPNPENTDSDSEGPKKQ
ncbi:hypothetical protein [Gordonia amicalis]|uniref:hypothetical protein n=1 Tax=Gordonia amicalis TaxID=89053 RepID=UPI0002A62317|nr:hypothetical protein [Gordonia amicalis]MCZ0911649.1 hypothetical protein [Gordonia amicalis]MCZ4649838.1 hypothetical protein [Gordonia amicalis]NKX79460.1 hypothetical protein [Gordonia amicalis]GAC54504.1 hypothetical protein GOAMI_32_00370 [Gordonia amicalis NBRC 100051 = JCM 11271]